MKHTIKIPLKLITLNDYVDKNRANKQYGNASKQKSERDIMPFLRKLPKIKKPVKIKIIWVENDKRRDPDNIAFAKKFILDALVKTKKLPNDNHEWVKGFQDGFEFAKEPEIIVELIEIETCGVKSSI